RLLVQVTHAGVKLALRNHPVVEFVHEFILCALVPVRSHLIPPMRLGAVCVARSERNPVRVVEIIRRRIRRPRRPLPLGRTAARAADGTVRLPVVNRRIRLSVARTLQVEVDPLALLPLQERCEVGDLDRTLGDHEVRGALVLVLEEKAGDEFCVGHYDASFICWSSATIASTSASATVIASDSSAIAASSRSTRVTESCNPSGNLGS